MHFSILAYKINQLAFVVKKPATYAGARHKTPYFFVEAILGSAMMESTAPWMEVSKDNLPYLSTSAGARSSWVKHAGPPMQPPGQAIPSMKLPGKRPVLAWVKATLH